MNSRVDTAPMRKTRGAFFTPLELAKFISDWAVRSSGDVVIEPSCGDAVFLRAAAASLEALGGSRPSRNQLVGFDIHQDSIDDAMIALQELGLEGTLQVRDFFESSPTHMAAAVVGNPPYIRFQGFTGRSRELAIGRAADLGIALSGLASSWAAFVIHGAGFLRIGGRMGLVLPAELLSVNYAAPVRRFLLENFASIDLVVFDELVFAGVQADVVVLLADGYRAGSSKHFHLHSAQNVAAIDTSSGRKWAPTNASDKWTDALAPRGSAELLAVVPGEVLQPLSSWGRVVSGTVTGANAYFSLSRLEARNLGISTSELRPLLPAGYSLANLTNVDRRKWSRDARDRKGYLFYPGQTPTLAAEAYIARGEAADLNKRYKCRVRTPWWRVPVAPQADLFVSYMSGSRPRIVGNDAHLIHLNSVHGLQARPGLVGFAKAVLPVLAMNSASLLSAELVGRSYGGGILKMEPREAARWLVPSPEAVGTGQFAGLLRRGRKLLGAGDFEGCTAIADHVLERIGEQYGMSSGVLRILRDTRAEMVKKRVTRGTSRI
ncbi:MAG TPA: N-6 DNA methylase [Galbitalea sp.]|jgi:adenine-specific DNA methylase|nr:N-6 DNA methylase [Galbitalea sp.]